MESDESRQALPYYNNLSATYHKIASRNYWRRGRTARYMFVVWTSTHDMPEIWILQSRGGRQRWVLHGGKFAILCNDSLSFSFSNRFFLLPFHYYYHRLVSYSPTKSFRVSQNWCFRFRRSAFSNFSVRYATHKFCMSARKWGFSISLLSFFFFFLVRLIHEDIEPISHPPPSTVCALVSAARLSLHCSAFAPKTPCFRSFVRLLI